MAGVEEVEDMTEGEDVTAVRGMKNGVKKDRRA